MARKLNYTYEETIEYCKQQIKYDWECYRNYIKLPGVTVYPSPKDCVLSILPPKYDRGFNPPSLKCIAGDCIKKQLFLKVYVNFVFRHQNIGYYYSLRATPFYKTKLGKICRKARDRSLEDIQKEIRHFYHE